MVLQCMSEERSQFFLGLRHRETVQVNFSLHPVLTPAQLSQNPVLDTLPGENELLSARKLGISRVPAKALLEHCETVGTCKASAWWRRRPTWLGRWGILSERLDVPDRLTEEAGVILIGLRIHETSWQ
jgi:hypothetical protein